MDMKPILGLGWDDLAMDCALIVIEEDSDGVLQEADGVITDMVGTTVDYTVDLDTAEGLVEAEGEDITIFDSIEGVGSGSWSHP